jgi:hypothetical protein
MNDQAIEQEIQAKGKTAARITPDRINEVIAGYNTFNVGAALRALNVPTSPAFDLLTMCVITLANGFTVTGESACASPENFDQEIGSKIALDNAKQKIWALEGYLLKQQLHLRAEFDASPKTGGCASTLPPHQQRVVDERDELDSKAAKLNSFFETPIFDGLDAAEQGRLRTQLVAMETYSDILRERIAAFSA